MTATKTIDWDMVKRRLHETERALERSFAPDEHRLEETLRRRAEMLASRTRVSRGAGEGAPVMVGVICGRLFGLRVGALQEVSNAPVITPVMRAPAGVAGVVNHRGQLRCVVSLQRLLALPRIGEASDARLALLKRHEIGVLFDGFVGIRHYGDQEVRLPEGETEETGTISSGVTPDGCTIIDTTKLASRLAGRGAGRTTLASVEDFELATNVTQRAVA
ncbi:MAG: chemotaxis protein CheW [Phycisphaerales bacterium]